MISSDASTFRVYAPLVSQMVLVIVALMGFTFAPPTHGTVLLLPLTADARARLPVEIFRHDALLLSVGPLPGSLVVLEVQQNLTIPMLRLGILSLAAPSAGCGPFSSQAFQS